MNGIAVSLPKSLPIVAQSGAAITMNDGNQKIVQLHSSIGLAINDSGQPITLTVETTAQVAVVERTVAKSLVALNLATSMLGRLSGSPD